MLNRGIEIEDKRRMNGEDNIEHTPVARISKAMGGGGVLFGGNVDLKPNGGVDLYMEPLAQWGGGLRPPPPATGLEHNGAAKSGENIERHQ